MSPNNKEIASKDQKPEWSERAAQMVVDLADSIREKGISPIYRMIRLVIYGIVAAILLVVIAVLLMLVVVRVLTDYVFFNQVWITYMVLGLIFIVLGFLLWSKRKANSKEK